MISAEEIKKAVFNISSNTEFNYVALAIFHFQRTHNTVYREYVSSLNIAISSITHYSQIPHLPIEFFKSKTITCHLIEANTTVFQSSGTTGQITSKHYVHDIAMYESSFIKGFELFYGSPSNYCILALLPNYLERSGSSLVYMFDRLIKLSNNPLSGFYLTNYDELLETIHNLKKQNQPTLLLGVTYALLDLADKNIDLSDQFMVMETGGMKGKRKELIKEELHTILKQQLRVSSMHSEYGMTELLSQAYSKKDGLLESPPWMKVMVRDTNDPFCYLPHGRSGGINIIDLANLYSCSFIETKDLGKTHTDQSFEIIGRFDNSDLRGCNLMIQ